MKKSTNSSKQKRKAATERGNNRLKFPRKELAAARAEDGDNVDRISELPEDILISIISRLTLPEATATSTLSTRWQYLYTRVPHLKFPPFKPLPGPNFEYVEEIQEKRFPNYINMINHTLDLYQDCRVLKEFRVHMHCLEGANIERWLEFALARKVEIIDIQMHYLINARLAHYSLSLPNLIGGRLLPGLKSLKELSLSAVHVDDGEVQLLLSNFPLLESLSIAFSERLINVSIAGHSLIKLKHLDISYANNLKSIEIDNMINLVSLRCYRLYAYVLKLNNVPKLTELASSDKRNNTFVKVLPTIPSRIRDQLLLLKLYTVVSLPKSVLPEFINVKHVELVHLMCQWCYTSNLFPLIEACSSLEKLVIKFLWPLSHTTLIDRKIYFPKMKLSPNFKKLKLSGYLGSTSELGIALFIIKNVVALEELTIEPCDVTQEIRRVATARAWQHFRPITPDSVNLVII